MHNVLENYTFPNPIFHDARTNVYAGAKEQILKGFSNMPEILQAYPSDISKTAGSLDWKMGTLYRRPGSKQWMMWGEAQRGAPQMLRSRGNFPRVLRIKLRRCGSGRTRALMPDVFETPGYRKPPPDART